MFPRTPETTEPETIRFGYADTALGMIAVAEGVRGVAALLIDDNRERLRANLEDVFPHATLVLDQSGLAQIIAKAVALVDAPHLGTDLTLDLRGSADGSDGTGCRRGLRSEPRRGRRALPSRREI
jgi:AraC family transcriptional regulator of adaptative response/methylated-DNA-[protein]-cysteine methyltransferase